MLYLKSNRSMVYLYIYEGPRTIFDILSYSDLHFNEKCNLAVYRGADNYTRYKETIVIYYMLRKLQFSVGD